MIDRILNHPSYRRGKKLPAKSYDTVLEKTMQYIDRHKVREQMKAFWQLLKDVLTRKITLPVWALFAIISACSYILSPIDLLPDLLPLGFIDDILLAIYTYENVIKQHVKVNSNQKQEGEIQKE